MPDLAKREDDLVRKIERLTWELELVSLDDPREDLVEQLSELLEEYSVLRKRKYGIGAH